MKDHAWEGFMVRPVGVTYHSHSHSVCQNSVLWLHLLTQAFQIVVKLCAQKEEEAGLVSSQWLSLK